MPRPPTRPRQVPQDTAQLARIAAIPVKKNSRPDLTLLTDTETQALLDAVPVLTWTGRRDRALLALAAHTGLCISELAGLSTDDLNLDPPAHVAYQGKGRSVASRRSPPP